MKNSNELKRIMRSRKELTKRMDLPIFVGFDDENRSQIVDLAEVGNLFVEGAIGQGKTDLLHTFAESIYHSPRRVYEGCVVYYIDPKSKAKPAHYLYLYLSEAEEIAEELEMLCDKIARRTNDPKFARYPVMVLLDDFDSLATADHHIAELLLEIVERGQEVGIHLVLASRPIEGSKIVDKYFYEIYCKIRKKCIFAEIGKSSPKIELKTANG